jgi:hypothetical protein
MLRELQREQIGALESCDYEHARKCESLVRQLMKAKADALRDVERRDRIAANEAKIEAARAALERSRARRQRALEEQKELFDGKFGRLAEAHEAEWRDFEGKWDSENFLQRFTKASPHLLQMKAIEKSLAVAKLFEQARGVQRVATLLERSESLERRELAGSSMEMERANITERQDREYQTLALRYRQAVDRLQCQTALEQKAILTRLGNLERDLVDLKGGTAKLGWPAPVADPREDIMSPRTALRFSAYRASPLVPKLDVPPMGSTPRREKGVRTGIVRVSSALH